MSDHTTLTGMDWCVVEVPSTWREGETGFRVQARRDVPGRLPNGARIVAYFLDNGHAKLFVKALEEFPYPD